MSPVAFLLIAVVVGVVGSLIMVMLNRRPTRADSAIRDFEREMQALAPRRSPTDSDTADPDTPRGGRPGVIIDATLRPRPVPPGQVAEPDTPRPASGADPVNGHPTDVAMPGHWVPRRRSSPTSRPGTGSGES